MTEMILAVVIIGLALMLFAIRRETRLYARARRRSAGRWRRFSRKERRRQRQLMKSGAEI
jgi:hypothetical protein